MWFCEVWLCSSLIVDTYVCMCLQIDSLRVNGTRDRDGKNPPPLGKRWQEIRRKRSEWVGGVDISTVNHCEGVRGSAWLLMTLHAPLHDAKSLWGLLLASITFLFRQHQKILRTHEALLQTVAQISQPWLHSTLWTTNNVHHSKRFNVVLVFWVFFYNKWKHMEVDHYCQESGQYLI